MIMRGMVMHSDNEGVVVGHDKKEVVVMRWKEEVVVKISNYYYEAEEW